MRLSPIIRVLILLFVYLLVTLSAYGHREAAKPPEVDSESAKVNSEHAEDDSPTFRYVGDRRDILQKGDLSKRIELSSLAEVPHLYAIGPVEGLRGEVTIYDGLPAIATLVEGQPRVHNSFDYGAIFLAYGSVSKWQTIPINADVDGLDAVESLVRESALEASLSLDEPFVFRIEGRAEQLDYHIIWKEDDTPHDRSEHQRSKRRFTVSEADVRIVGVWADSAGEGVYTHPGKRTHLHFVLQDGSTSGHIDGLSLEPGTTLFLPQ